MPSKQSVDGSNPSGGVSQSQDQHWVLGFHREPFFLAKKVDTGDVSTWCPLLLDQMHAGGKRLVEQGYSAADPEFESWLVELWEQK